MQAVLISSFGAGVAGWVILFILLKSGLASRIAVDKPNWRSLHVRAVPRVGGLVVVGIGLIAMVTAGRALQMLAIITSGLVVVCTIDDRRGLSVLTRLVVQLVAATAAVVTLMTPAPLWILMLGIVAIVWATNLYNFMDGSDGLAGGMTLFGFGAFAFVATSAGAAEMAGACGCIAGAAAGFLFHNFPRAKVFLGDAGSIPLGFIAAVLSVAGWQQQIWPLWFPVLVFSPFIIDATVTLVRRAVAGKRVWEAHREHLYQRMVTHRWGHAQTAVAWYALMGAAAASAIAAVRWPNRWQIVLLVGWVALYAALYIVVSRMTASGKHET